VSGPKESNGRVETPAGGASVLANLPRTRPQRATARRAAARRSGEAETAARTPMAPSEGSRPAPGPRPASAATKPAKPRPRTAKAAPRTAKAARPSAPARPRGALRTVEPVPRQGFESEAERASGPVSPPGAVELLGSAAELFGELARASVSSGERLLRDVLSRLPGPGT